MYKTVCNILTQDIYTPKIGSVIILMEKGIYEEL